MVGVDFDFARYVAYRRGMIEQRAREGGAYAYSGERKVRRTLGSARPVSLAIEATTRLWKSAAKDDLLADATRATDQDLPRLYRAQQAAALALGLAPPPVYALPDGSTIRAQALGTDDDCTILVAAGLLDALSDRELVALIGHELGHVQNNHTLYSTALHYLQHSGVLFVRWIVQPAIMTLQAWSRRAEITCDRAALIATRDLDATLSAMVKVALGPEKAAEIDVSEYVRELPKTQRGVGKYAELFHSHPYLPKRVQALELFANSQFYRKITGADASEGLTAEDVDTQVAEILSVF
jgi:Zn-dependent protease with chaperone function